MRGQSFRQHHDRAHAESSVWVTFSLGHGAGGVEVSAVGQHSVVTDVGTIADADPLPKQLLPSWYDCVLIERERLGPLQIRFPETLVHRLRMLRNCTRAIDHATRSVCQDCDWVSTHGVCGVRCTVGCQSASAAAGAPRPTRLCHSSMAARVPGKARRGCRGGHAEGRTDERRPRRSSVLGQGSGPTGGGAFPVAQAPGADHAPLVPGDDYFQVRVRRVEVAYEREWLEKYAPMLVVATEFSYGGETVTRPAVIGPSMMEQAGVAAPISTTIADTVVAGPHPIRAGGVGVTVALHRVARGTLSASCSRWSTARRRLWISPWVYALHHAGAGGCLRHHGADRRRPGPGGAVAPSSRPSSPATSCWCRRGRSWTLPRSPSSMESCTPPSPEFHAGPRRRYAVYSVERAAPADVHVTRLPLHRRCSRFSRGQSREHTGDMGEHQGPALRPGRRRVHQSRPHLGPRRGSGDGVVRQGAVPPGSGATTRGHGWDRRPAGRPVPCPGRHGAVTTAHGQMSTPAGVVTCTLTIKDDHHGEYDDDLQYQRSEGKEQSGVLGRSRLPALWSSCSSAGSTTTTRLPSRRARGAGKALYAIAFGDESGRPDYPLRTAFESTLRQCRSRGMRLRLRLVLGPDVKDLAKYPWEFMYLEAAQHEGFFLAGQDTSLSLTRFFPARVSGRTVTSSTPTGCASLSWCRPPQFRG